MPYVIAQADHNDPKMTLGLYAKVVASKTDHGAARDGLGASLVRAARRLGVQTNTITYRVKRAEELLGRPVVERRLELRVALRLARLGPT